MRIGLWLFGLCLLSLLRAQETRKVDVTTSTLESGINDIQWVGRDSRIVLILTNEGYLWRSTNSGRTFRQIINNIKKDAQIPNDQEIKIESIVVHPKDSSTVLVSSSASLHFVTHDGGATWHQFGPPMRIYNFVWHPHRVDHALFSRWTNGCSTATREQIEECNHMLFVTKDGGRSMEKIADYVIQLNWGGKFKTHNEHQCDRIFYTAHRMTRGPQPKHGGWHSTVDFWRYDGARSHLLVKGGNKFLISNQYTFVAQIEDPLRQTVNLQVSSDNSKTFRKAIIPTTLKEKSYTILDTSEGGVMLHVNHGSAAPGILEGNVYISDGAGLRYSLSLPNNIRSANGECEFDRVMGVDGVYLANFRDALIPSGSNVSMSIDDDKIDDQQQQTSSQDDALGLRHSLKSPKRTSPVVRTVISFDKGGFWDYLKPPKVDTLGKPIVCEDPARCHLHLHGITQFDRFAPFYSVESALGIIMGTGNVGSHLTKAQKGSEVNTYISRDAGLTWHEAHKGAYIYEYGDHGGLVVMANDNTETDQVVFSWNEGHSWYDFTLGRKGVTVDNVVIEPTSSGLEFLLYGAYGDGRGAVFHLDFATLGQPPCAGASSPGAAASDYEVWQSSDRLNTKCLLGRKIQYTRRKVTSECFNGRDFKREVLKEPCACTMDDYECEIGFYRKVGDQLDDGCQVSPYNDRDYLEIDGCTSSGIYYTNAYRKVPGDQCANGWKPEKVAVPCPPSSPLPSRAKGALSLVCLVGFAIAFLAWAGRHPVLRKYVHHTGFDSFMEVGYSVVVVTTEKVARGGEELFNFWSSNGQPNFSANQQLEMNEGSTTRMNNSQFI